MQNIFFFFWLFFFSNNERATTTCSHFETVYMADLLTCESEKFFTNFKKSTHTHKYLKVQQYDTARATDIYFVVVVASVAAISLFIFHTFVLLLFFSFLSLFYIIGFICVSFFFIFISNTNLHTCIPTVCYARIFLYHTIFIIFNINREQSKWMNNSPKILTFVEILIIHLYCQFIRNFNWFRL